MANVDLEMLKQKLEEGEIPNASGNVDVSVTQMTEALYECVRLSKYAQQQSRAGSRNVMQSRWEKMVNNKDNAEVWRAVNWDSEFSPDYNPIEPSDEEFKTCIKGT